MFKKLGVYGRKRPRKSAASQKPSDRDFIETVSLLVESQHLLNEQKRLIDDEVSPATLPHLPKPPNDDTSKQTTFDEPSAPTSTNSV